MTPADLAEAGLPLTVDARTAAEWLGCGYETLLAGVKTGDAPVMPIRCGRILRFSTALLLGVLGLDPGSNEGRPRQAGPSHIASIAATADDTDHAT